MVPAKPAALPATKPFQSFGLRISPPKVVTEMHWRGAGKLCRQGPITTEDTEGHREHAGFTKARTLVLRSVPCVAISRQALRPAKPSGMSPCGAPTPSLYDSS